MQEQAKANVLIVDDRPENLLALETVLSDLDQNLVRAYSAHEALRKLLLEDFALILLDVQMPGMSGFDLAELIRERERTQHTPIIFVTADTSEKDYIFKGYSLGAVDYLTKPIEPEILKSKVSFFSRLFIQQQQIKRQAAELESANQRLDHLNVELEERVRQRTEELEIANRELEAEVKDRRESEARLATEHEVTRALGAAESMASVRPRILRAFINNMNAVAASLWELEPGSDDLRCVHIETADGEAARLRTFVAESMNRRFKAGVGLPGHVWQKLEAVWLPNTLRGEQYPRATVAAAAGLHSAVGFPIKIGSEFYGVIEFFTLEPLPFSKPLANMLDAICSEIGQFIRRKRAEEERERLIKREKALREQAENANRLKDEFLATVSHELRTPLNSILGWSQLVLNDQIGPGEVRAALETIHRNARSQSQLINDLLDASRLITGKLSLDLTPSDVVPVIEAAIDVVRPAASSKRISISARYASDSVSVMCDPTRLQQMVWNLVANAVKFTPEGGRIDVTLENDGESVRIVVADSGVGISRDFLPFVFDRFRQQDSSSTRRHEGLGLGLAIVRHLAELHGGNVSVHSDGEGTGATFTISLPTSRTNASDGNSARESVEVSPGLNGARLNGLRIHIVDDDADACTMLKFALTLQGASVETSSSVPQALTAISDRQPDVLLADINMPGEDGYSLIKKIRSLPDGRTSKIPAIAVSAMARSEDTERAIAAGFELHIPKPIEIDDLSHSIAELVARK